jgi:hypothetical protein
MLARGDMRFLAERGTRHCQFEFFLGLASSAGHSYSPAMPKRVQQMPQKQQAILSSAWWPIGFIVGILVLQAVALHLMGRLAICACGYVKFWEGDSVGPGNSQHLTDWYTFSHLLHGFWLYFLLWLVFKHRPVAFRLSLAVVLEAAWEIAENSPFIIDRYRSATISLNYYGDTIVNSLSDTLTAIIGFLIAASLPTAATIAAGTAIEAGLAFAIRDNLALNIVMLVHEVPWIKAWQAAGQAH